MQESNSPQSRVNSIQIHCGNESEMVDFGRRLGQVAGAGAVIYLEGILGAGKTTLCRGVLRAFGHEGAVKSPTYTLVEPYQFATQTIYHFDLYRLGNPEELEFMGARDYFKSDNLCLIEWPERGAGFLPAADLVIKIFNKEGLTNAMESAKVASVDGTPAESGGRYLVIEAQSDKGEQILQHIRLEPRLDLKS